MKHFGNWNISKVVIVFMSLMQWCNEKLWKLYHFKNGKCIPWSSSCYVYFLWGRKSLILTQNLTIFIGGSWMVLFPNQSQSSSKTDLLSLAGLLGYITFHHNDVFHDLTAVFVCIFRLWYTHSGVVNVGLI